MGNLGKKVVATGFKKLPKVQQFAQSGHTVVKLLCDLCYIFYNTPDFCSKQGGILIDWIVCWPVWKWRLTEEILVTNISMVCCLNNFWSIIKSHFGLTELTFHLQFTGCFCDQKFPTFKVPIYPYKMNILHCFETFLSGTCRKKFPFV